MAVANPQDWPLPAYQRVRRRSALALMSTWGTSWGDDFVKWEYLADLSVDMVYYSTGLETRDPLVVHQIRTLFYHFDVQEKMVHCILDFAEMMGGKSAKVQNSFDNLLKERVDAERLHMEQGYARYQEKMSQMVEEIASLDEAAVRAKNAAFL